MNKVTTSINEIYLDAQGILHVTVLDNAEITLEKVKEDYQTIVKHFGPGKFLVLSNIENSFIITPEARHFAQQEAINKLHRATAITGNNPVSRIIINLLMRLNPPATPFKLFAGEKEAIEWLLQQAK